MASILLPILPSAVSLPVAVTVTIAKPLATVVPLKMVGSSLFASLKTESDSPVNTDSFTEKSLDLTITPSAAMEVPSSTIKKSPTTNSSLLISMSSPLRITLELGSEKFFNFSKAFLLLASWNKEMVATNIIAQDKKIPSPVFPLTK